MTPAEPKAIPTEDPRDIALMLALFHSGPVCRDVALDMADRNRRAARPDPQFSVTEKEVQNAQDHARC